MSIGAGPWLLLLLLGMSACSLVIDDAALYYSIARALIRAYVVMFPVCSCRCCCSGPFVPLSSAAIFTASGSVGRLANIFAPLASKIAFRS